MMIELKRLRYLVVLANRLSYSRAAEDLGLSQSTLTRAIQSLERDIGIRLFDRDRSGVNLTEQGRWVVAKAEGLLISAKDLDLQLASAFRGHEGQIRFGMTQLPAFILLPTAMADRVADAPAFGHDVMVRDAEALWGLVASGDIEFFVSAEWEVPQLGPVRSEVLGEFPVSLIVRGGHPLIAAAGVTDRRFPMLVANTGSIARALPMDLRERFAGSVQVIEDFNVLASITRATDAIWLTSSYAVAHDLAAGVFAELPLPDEAWTRNFRLMMYSLARRSQSAATVQFKQAFRNRIRQIADLTAGKPPRARRRPGRLGRAEAS